MVVKKEEYNDKNDAKINNSYFHNIINEMTVQVNQSKL